MEELTASCSAPILRLGPDAWTLVTSLIDGSDAVRLYTVGNSTLSAILAQQTRCLSLRWAATRYMDLDNVFTLVQRYNHLHELDFEPKIREKLLWVPVNWSSLPLSLTMLKLSFDSAPSILLGSHDLQRQLPVLRGLELADTGSVRGNPAQRMALNLRHLPSTLTSLRLASERSHYFSLDSLSQLPSGLEELDLNMTLNRVPSAIEGETSHNLDAIPIDSSTVSSRSTWPPCITSLTLSLNLELERIDTGTTKDLTLPPSLKTLRFNGSGQTPNFDDWKRYLHLSSVEEFYIPNYKLAAYQATDLVKAVPSLKKINFIIDSLSRTHVAPFVSLVPDIAEFAQHVAGKLVRYRKEESRILEEAIVNQMVPTPHLTTLALYSARDCTIPDSVTTFSTGGGVITPNERLQTFNFYARQLIPLSITRPFPPTLVHMSYVSRLAMTEEDLSILPSTLETLGAAFTEKSWRALMALMNVLPPSVNRFPRLTKVKIDNGLHDTYSCRLSVDCLEHIPRQLREVDLHLKIFQFYEIRTETLTAFQESGLTKVKLALAVSSSLLQAPATLQLLNHLPRGLRSLSMIAAAFPLPTWPVKFPPNLTELRILRLMQESATFPKGAEPDPGRGIELPDSLEILDWDPFGSQLPDSYLPPNLSHISDADYLNEYFKTRPRPKGLEGRSLVNVDH